MRFGDGFGRVWGASGIKKSTKDARGREGIERERKGREREGKDKGKGAKGEFPAGGGRFTGP